jgi:hypothetical protein
VLKTVVAYHQQTHGKPKLGASPTAEVAEVTTSSEKIRRFLRISGMTDTKKDRLQAWNNFKSFSIQILSYVNNY